MLWNMTGIRPESIQKRLVRMRIKLDRLSFFLQHVMYVYKLPAICLHV